MKFTMTPAALAGLVEAIQVDGRKANADQCSRLASRIATTGWATPDQIDEMIWSAGCTRWNFRADAAAKMFGIPMRPAYFRPRSQSASTFGTDCMAAPDLADMLIAMEQFGLSIDPLPLVRALRPALLARQLLTDAELRVLWFEKSRHRMQPVTAAVADIGPLRLLAPDRKVTLPTGYRAEIWTGADKEDLPRLLIVTKPKRDNARAAA